MRGRPLSALLTALALAVGGCGGGDGNEGSGPAEQASGDEKQAVEKVVRTWVDDDACDIATDEFSAEGFASAEEGRQNCLESREEDPGLRKGEYTIKSISIDGDQATAVLALNGGGTRTYRLERGGELGWLIDDFSEKLAGPVGTTFSFQEGYERNGEPISVHLRVTVLEVEDGVPAPEFYEADPDKRWVRARIRIKSRGNDSFAQDLSRFTLIDGKGQRYDADGTVFEPSLGNGSVDLAPGDNVVGYLGFEVPRGEEPKEIRLTGFAGGSPLQWRIP